ncbi:hypothetical protein PanWU01x14_318280 [Parasponia andersonii]|uniref:Uncharacterized protein n=1 Tax=Parasponia andersonii TaxID=3476 RepID=A0A2P5AMD1_PARAD|nr:hypothetical protein PanWU01x14_318280 [Parasponia andersonii]
MLYSPTVHVFSLSQSALNSRQGRRGRGTHGLYMYSPEIVYHPVYNLRTEYLFLPDFFQRSRAPDFRRLLWLESVRGEIWTNRRSVRTACPPRTPTQDRIKCSVWVWSCELLSIVFWWKTLGASDPPAVEVRIGLGRVYPGSGMGSALISDSPMADVVSCTTRVAFS